MRTLGANITALKDTKAGAAPTWILKLTVGGVDYYLSDNEYTIAPWSVDTLPWITSWGELRQGVSGAVGEYQIADFVVSCLVDPDATTSIETLIEDDIEESRCELYVWFHGSTDAPVTMFTGYVREVTQQSETSVAIQIQDESITFERLYVGETADENTYPDIDPDDIGKLEPIIYGTVDRVPALAIEAGAVTSIPNAISKTQTTFAVSDGAALQVGDVIQIDEENILINGITGDEITSCTRGYNATDALFHGRGSLVLELRGESVYLLAHHALDSVDKLIGRVGQAEMDIKSIATIYPSGNAEYPGKAVAVVPGAITIQQAVDLLVEDGITIDDGITVEDLIAILDGIAVDDTISVSDTIAVSDGIGVDDGIGLSNGNHYHGSNINNSKTQAGDSLPQTDSTTSLSAPLYVNPSFTLAGGTVTEGTYSMTVIPYGSGGCDVKVYNGSTTITLAENYDGVPVSWSGTLSGDTIPYFIISKSTGWTGEMSYKLTDAQRTISFTSDIYNTEVSKSGTVSKTGTASKTGAATKEGQASKSGTVSKDGTVNKNGTVSKLGTVTASGNSTANTLIADAVFFSGSRNFATPADALNALLNTDVDVPTGKAVTVEQIGTLPASYAINGAITEKRTALEWANRFAFQLRSYLRFFDGKAQLMVRPDTYTSDKTIDACQIDTTGRKVWAREKTARDDVINVIELKYNRDWSDVTDEPYRGVTKASDSASITVFGECERPRLFECEFVTSAAMADDLRDFYLARQSTRSWRHTFSTFLNNIEIDFNDAVTLGFRGNEVAAIKETRFAPGDYRKIDTITFVAED